MRLTSPGPCCIRPEREHRHVSRDQWLADASALPQPEKAKTRGQRMGILVSSRRTSGRENATCADEPLMHTWRVAVGDPGRRNPTRRNRSHRSIRVSFRTGSGFKSVDANWKTRGENETRRSFRMKSNCVYRWKSLDLERYID